MIPTTGKTGGPVAALKPETSQYYPYNTYYYSSAWSQKMISQWYQQRNSTTRKTGHKFYEPWSS